MKSLISKKRLRKEEERRTKQSLDSPQTIEANKNFLMKLKSNQDMTPTFPYNLENIILPILYIDNEATF